MPADIHVCQWLLRLPFLLCPRLQYVPLLPHGVWLRVSTLFSWIFSYSTLYPLQCVWDTEAPLRASPSSHRFLLLSPVLQSQSTWQEVILSGWHKPILVPWVRVEGAKLNQNVCINELRTVNEHLSILVLVWSAWLPTSLINDMASHLIDLTSLFIHDYKDLLYIKCQVTEQSSIQEIIWQAWPQDTVCSRKFLIGPRVMT